MRRSCKFLIRPAVKQAAALVSMLEDHRELCNAALEHRRTAWQRAGVTVRYGDQPAGLEHIRRAGPDGQGRWSFCSRQATLRGLGKAFAAFSGRVQAGGKPGYPGFKGRGWFGTVERPEDGDGCRRDCQPGGQARVRFRGAGQVKVNRHRLVRGTVKTVSVKREGRRWYVILSCGTVPGQILPVTGAVTGTDTGVAWFLAASQGTRVAHPRYFQTARDRLAAAQRVLARRERGSRRGGKARDHVAAVHRKIRNQRLDFARKTALTLVHDHGLIARESLRITNMTRSASGTLAEPGTGVAARSGLNKPILDAGWGVFPSVLHAKADSAGRMVAEVEARHTSRRCARCGHLAAGNRVSQAEFRCLSCGNCAHADQNAAQNILRAGLALQAAQAA